MCLNTFSNNLENDYICEVCNLKIKSIKKLEMIDKASKRLSKIKSIYNKENLNIATSKVKKRVYKGIDWFDSSLEAMLAIQMTFSGIEYESQKNIGRLKADFVIPEAKTVLEVDGELYHQDCEKENNRDKKILKRLGKDWKIIHLNEDTIPYRTNDLINRLDFVFQMREVNGISGASVIYSNFMTLYDLYKRKMVTQK